MRRRLLLGFLLFAVVAMALLVIPVGYTLNSNARSSTLVALRRDTSALATVLANDIGRNRIGQATRVARTYSRTTGRQILVLEGAKTLIASKQSQVGDQEIAGIVQRVGRVQLSGVIPRSSVEGAQYYVAMRLPLDAVAARRLSTVILVVTFPVTVVTRAVHSNWINLAIYGLFMLAAAVAFGFLLSTSLTRPLRNIGRAVEALASGQLRVRAPVDEGPEELRRLAESINAMSSRLVDALEAQRSFVADASHQLRTPLTALQIQLENLQEGDGSITPAAFEPALSEVSRLRWLVESLLELARNESREPLLVPVDLALVAQSRAAFWRPLAEERGLTLVAPASASLAVLAMTGVIEQVVDNLLSNAFDATEPGGRISVETRAVGAVGELHVIDSGVGLSDEDRHHALQRFWRGRENHAEGSGLGLAIADQLVRLSAGTIELRAAPGHGIDATISLQRV
ncbi:MAG: sensor histidine kinase [Acidimicrobiales bacterium]